MRRTIRAKSMAFAALLAAVSLRTGAGSVHADPDFSLTRVTDKISVIYGPLDLPDARNRGFRNNPVVVFTSDGVVVMDPGGSAWAGEMVVRAIRARTEAPIVAIFDSHVHGDHWLGNEGVRRSFPEAVIYGHPLMKTRVEGADGTFWLDQIERLTEGCGGGKEVVGPNKVVTDGDVIAIGDTEFRIHHIGKAHTDNDIMIEIVGEDVLFTGDVVRNGLLGIMEADASFGGNMAAIESIAAMGFRLFIPGHGRVGGREMVLRYRDYLQTILTTVRELYGDGLADYEMTPAVRGAVSEFRDWSNFDRLVGAHVSRAYLEVEAEEF